MAVGTAFALRCSSSDCFSGAVSSSNIVSSAQRQRQSSVSNGPLQLPTGHRSGGRPSIAQATAPGALGSKVVCSGYAQQQCPATRLHHVSGPLGSIVCRSSSSLQCHRLSLATAGSAVSSQQSAVSDQQSAVSLSSTCRGFLTFLQCCLACMTSLC